MKIRDLAASVAPVAFVLGSSMAFAAMSPSPGMQSGQGQPTQPSMQEPPAPSSVGHVSAQEMKNFAASVKEIQPINQHVQAIAANKSLNKEQKQEKVRSYGKQAMAILSEHHLTPDEYNSLIHKAETDPSFAKRANAEIQKIG